MSKLEQLDIKSTIPSGNDLRVLLNSDHISYGEVHKTLQEKGIYIWDSEKSVTVPLLSSTLLTPDEFSRLIEVSVDRESKPKNKTSSVELTALTTDWIDPLRNLDFSDELLPTKGIDTTQFSVSPQVVIENKDKVKIAYSILSKKYNEDWIQSELKFEAEVTITHKDGKLQLDFSSTHTSKETEAINRNIVNKITRTLYESKAISKPELKQINFLSFDNEERVRFFKRLTAGKAKRLLKGDVDNIEITFDQTISDLPDDPKISWMKDTVKRLKIDGEKLNDIFLIAEELYYKYYHIQKMDIEFPFRIGTNKGISKICFSFSSPSRKEEDAHKGELTFSCVKINYENDPNKDAKKKISDDINQALQEMIDATYQKTLEERKD